MEKNFFLSFGWIKGQIMEPYFSLGTHSKKRPQTCRTRKKKAKLQRGWSKDNFADWKFSKNAQTK